MRSVNFFVLLICILISGFLFGCGGSSSDNEDKKETVDNTESKSDYINNERSTIINYAQLEQQNIMYSPYVDSTYLYWLDSTLVILNGSTKCNIFALNVLYESGFRTPSVNALSRDLFDTTYFTDELPVVGIDDASKAEKGDLVIWRGHVIIFESLVNVNDDLYAMGYWAGTGREDNGTNIVNNVCHGKYRLGGEYVVRRPIRK